MAYTVYPLVIDVRTIMVGESGGMSRPKTLSLSVFYLFFYFKVRLTLRGEMTGRIGTILTAAPQLWSAALQQVLWRSSITKNKAGEPVTVTFFKQSFATNVIYIYIWSTHDDGQKTVTETCWVLIFNYASQTFLTWGVLNVNCDSS